MVSTNFKVKDNEIKTGLISSYSTDKNIFLNELDVNKAMITHLNFDFTYIGHEKKINILNSWMKELNINYDNLAYIGDDINDIEILKLVKFSACPNDAVNECKQIVNYICENKGGDGCVREFVEKAFYIMGYEIGWKGEGVNEIGYDISTGRELIFISDKYFRPSEVEELLGDSTKARTELGWKPSYTFDELVSEMVNNDCNN